MAVASAAIVSERPAPCLKAGLRRHRIPPTIHPNSMILLAFRQRPMTPRRHRMSHNSPPHQ
jgi:hypothetical protein